MIRQEILSYSEKERGGDGGFSESMDAYCKDFSFFATYFGIVRRVLESLGNKVG